MQTATKRSNLSGGNVRASGLGANVVHATVVVPADTADGTTIAFVPVPSNARISGLSEIAWDKLDDTNAMTLDVGIAGIGPNAATVDADAINDGLDATDAGVARLVPDHADYGLPLWQLAGLSSDPGGAFWITVTTADDEADETGDVSVSVVYTVD